MWTSLIRLYPEEFNNETIRHILKNYSESEIGLHHKQLPLGFVLRDQGQTDLFAGSSRIILSMEGYTVHIADTIGFAARQMQIYTEDIESFRILGRHFNKKIHEGAPVLTPKDSGWGNLSVLGPQTTIIDSQGGTCSLINPVKLSDVFNPEILFQPSEHDLLLGTPELRIYHDLKRWGCF